MDDVDIIFLLNKLLQFFRVALFAFRIHFWIQLAIVKHIRFVALLRAASETLSNNNQSEGDHF